MHTDSPKSENIISVNNIHFSFKSVKYSIISNISQPNIFQTFLWFEINPWMWTGLLRVSDQSGRSKTFIKTLYFDQSLWVIIYDRSVWPITKSSKWKVNMDGQNENHYTGTGKLKRLMWNGQSGRSKCFIKTCLLD